MSYFARTLLIVAVLMNSGCSEGVSETVQNMEIKITRVEPGMPLDPFSPFEVYFEISNNGNKAIEIPDLNRLTLRIYDDNRQLFMSRQMRQTKSFEVIKRERKSKKNQILHPVMIQSNNVYKSIFNTLDAFKALDCGNVALSLHVELQDGIILDSERFPIEVTIPEIASSYARSHGESFVGSVLTQKLHTLPSRWKNRLIFISSIYPDFESVVFDGKLPKRNTDPSLLLYWPSNDIRHRFSIEKTAELEIYEVKNPPPGAISNKLKLVDRIPLSGQEKVLGVIQVTRDENRVGSDDYILVLEKETCKIDIQYWRRNWNLNEWNFTNLDITEFVGNSFNSIKIDYCRNGISVRGDDRDIAEINLLEDLGKIRNQAINSDNEPVKISPGN